MKLFYKKWHIIELMSDDDCYSLSRIGNSETKKSTKRERGEVESEEIKSATYKIIKDLL